MIERLTLKQRENVVFSGLIHARDLLEKYPAASGKGFKTRLAAIEATLEYLANLTDSHKYPELYIVLAAGMDTLVNELGKLEESNQGSTH